MFSVYLANGLILDTGMCASQQCKTHSSMKIIHVSAKFQQTITNLFLGLKNLLGRCFTIVFTFAENSNSLLGLKFAN